MQIDALMYKIVPRHVLSGSLWWIVTLKGVLVYPLGQGILPEIPCALQGPLLFQWKK